MKNRCKCGTVECKICVEYYKCCLKIANRAKKRHKKVGQALEDMFRTLWLNNSKDFDIMAEVLSDHI